MSKRVVIVGAGEAGRMLVREMRANAASVYDVVAFLDDDKALHGTKVEGVDVSGPTTQLPVVVAREKVDEVVIAIPSARREFVRSTIALCRDAGVAFRIVPGLLEIIKGPVRLDHIRDVHPEDLLGRESVEFDEEAISSELSGRTVLVTGAGGSIGSEICRQISRFNLDRLILLGRGENQIYHIEKELEGLKSGLRTEAVITDIRDATALHRVFATRKPDFVYHAAAHKHVHYMEAFPEEAVKNNVFGTLNVIEAAIAAGTKRVVMLSTDKAVSPRGVMGATKRLAEYLMIDRGRDTDTRLITVRFGNVLASRGSVVPLFIQQIRDGGPVTVSDEQTSRFFMSLKEACMLVVQASLMGKGGEVFILRMGDPIRIVELARDLIALHGYKPGVDIAIKITGLRPGEKMHEELVVEGETPVESGHGYILASRGSLPESLDLEMDLAELRRLADDGDGEAIRRFFHRIIPDADMQNPRRGEN